MERPKIAHALKICFNIEYTNSMSSEIKKLSFILYKIEIKF